MNYLQSLITAIILLLFALAGTALVAFTYDSTHERIEANERATLQRKLNRLIPAERYDNTLLEDTLQVTDTAVLGTGKPVTVYRARHGGAPAGLVMATTAPDGYSGSIRLLVGINVDGTLSGVRVVAHRETPGLGDAIEEDRSDWIRIFDGRSLDNPPLARWAVRKDGGDFDQLTGATVTPRAVIKAVRQALLYYREHQQALFAVAGQDASGEQQTAQ